MWNDEPIERGWQTTRFDYKKISNNQHQPVSDSLRVAFAIDRALGRNCSHQPDHNEYDPADANDPKARRVSVNLHLIAAKEVRSVPFLCARRRFTRRPSRYPCPGKSGRPDRAARFQKLNVRFPVNLPARIFLRRLPPFASPG